MPAKPMRYGSPLSLLLLATVWTAAPAIADSPRFADDSSMRGAELAATRVHSRHGHRPGLYLKYALPYLYWEHGARSHKQHRHFRGLQGRHEATPRYRDFSRGHQRRRDDRHRHY